MSSVIITGASRGIGFATTKEFLEQGWNVVACSRNLSSLRDLRLKYGARLQLVKLDLSNKESIHHSASQILDANQSIDVLIHNAGYLVNKPFSKITADELEAAYWVNALGPFLLTQQLLPALKERAHVLAISSMGGFQGSIKFPGLTAYSSSKAAIASLMECWQEEFKDSQQAYNCLCIGAVQTEMLEEAFPGYQAPVKPQQMAAFIYQFATQSGKVMRGKVIPVSMSNP
jgi:3-oxoacyl-[acyl-carrier protein] reductase